VLPLYYKHNKFQSFVRQLNMYDFHKTRNKEKEKEFKHEYLRKGKPEFLKYIKRKLGDENLLNTGKSEALLQKCRILEEKCSTFEALAKIALPVKKLKMVGGEDCGLLVEGLMSFIEQASQKAPADEERAQMHSATLEYLEKIRKIKRGSSFEPDAQPRASKEAAFDSAATADQSSSSLSKRCLSSEDEELDSSNHQKLRSNFCEDLYETISCSNSLGSDEFNLDLLDFNTQTHTFQLPFECHAASSLGHF
jgi:hypothetical protein